MKVLNKPSNSNYIMPFEGKKHRGTIILLPYRADTWGNSGLNAKKCFLDLVKNISKYEHVYLVVDSRVTYSIDEFKLPNVKIIHESYNDSWARDNTLIFLKNNMNKIRAVDFRFNAWGGEYDGLYTDYTDDDKLGESLANELKVNFYKLEKFILEGGSIHTNGNNTFVVTEACLLSKGRNPDLSKNEIEKFLFDYLNAKKVIWIPNGIYNDETDEHVDNMAVFVDETTIMLAFPEDETDIQYISSKKAYDILSNETTSDGKKIKVIKCITPSVMYMTSEEESLLVKSTDAIDRKENNRLAGSYINFYQSDKFVLLPKFNVVEDEKALELMKEVYPNKDIIQIESRELLIAGGNIHCVTMQVPEGEFDYED